MSKKIKIKELNFMKITWGISRSACCFPLFGNENSGGRSSLSFFCDVSWRRLLDTFLGNVTGKVFLEMILGDVSQTRAPETSPRDVYKT